MEKRKKFCTIEHFLYILRIFPQKKRKKVPFFQIIPDDADVFKNFQPLTPKSLKIVSLSGISEKEMKKSVFIRVYKISGKCCEKVSASPVKFMELAS